MTSPRAAGSVSSAGLHRGTCNEVITSRQSGEAPIPGRRIGPLARVEMALIRLYQLARRGHPSPCRYVPSCSQYALESVARHGALRGTWLGARRLGRCHPWGGYGADPVPE
jgi:putative membrane protein insertion efficiency factor